MDQESGTNRADGVGYEVVKLTILWMKHGNLVYIIAVLEKSRYKNRAHTIIYYF